MAPKDAEKKALNDYFVEERNGVTLKASLVDEMVKYCIESDIDVKEVKESDNAVILSTFEEAWQAYHGADMPKMRLVPVRVWLGLSSPTDKGGVDVNIDTTPDATDDEKDLFAVSRLTHLV